MICCQNERFTRTVFQNDWSVPGSSESTVSSWRTYCLCIIAQQLPHAVIKICFCWSNCNSSLQHCACMGRWDTLFASTQVAEDFVRQSGLSLLEAIQYNSEGEVRLRATHLLEHHFISHHMVKTFCPAMFGLSCSGEILHIWNSEAITCICFLDRWTESHLSESAERKQIQILGFYCHQSNIHAAFSPSGYRSVCLHFNLWLSVNLFCVMDTQHCSEVFL